MVLCVFVWGAGTSPQLCWCQRCALWATLSQAMICRHRSVCFFAVVVETADMAWCCCDWHSGGIATLSCSCSSTPVQIQHARLLVIPAVYWLFGICLLVLIKGGCSVSSEEWLFGVVLQVVINCGALQCLLSLLTANHKKSIKKEACWTISNITAGTKEQIQSVIDNQLIPPLVHLLGVSWGQQCYTAATVGCLMHDAALLVHHPVLG